MLITLARKPLMGSVVHNVLAHGCGALNIDASRIAGLKPNVKNIPFEAWRKTEGRDDRQNPCQTYNQAQGRWPANVLIGSEAVLAGFPASVSGWKDSDTHKGDQGVTRNFGATGITGQHYGDSGSAARFFKQIKGNDTP